jgi:tRNA(Ile2)-agmatinylcytidine synthase
MVKKTLHIGLDDTDSTRKGCTTYIAALLVEKLANLGVEFIDYPNLVRLNPNVPWKTRGNGALCLRINHNNGLEEKIKDTVTSTVEEHADLEYEGTDPGIVFLERGKVPKEIEVFAKNTVSRIVTLKDALKLLAKFKVEAIGFKNGRGIIGGLAAIGETLREDHTYEIIAYRVKENYGLKRKVDEASIFEMDKETEPYTFNNVDMEKERVIITPRGSDPILFGIRGETPRIVKKAFELIKHAEPVERWVIFRTNQGTDAHLKRIHDLSQAEQFNSVIARGMVSSNPRIIPLRHVIFSVDDGIAQVDCAAYEPTGVLRKIARELIIGDKLEVYGGVRPACQDKPLTINLEKIRVLELAQKNSYSNPVCPSCGRRLKSMGKNKGFRCEKCRSRYVERGKTEIREKRRICVGLYIASSRSQRHLTKPFRRYGMEKRYEPVNLISCWHVP